MAVVHVPRAVPLQAINTNIPKDGVIHLGKNNTCLAKHPENDPTINDENAGSHHKKRKNEATGDDQESSDATDEEEEDSDIDDNDPRLMYIDLTPQQVRRKIRDYTAGGNMKVGEFQEAIGVTSTAYQRFMRMNGSHAGEMCDTYPKAAKFFKKLKLQGVKTKMPPRAKKTEKNTDSSKEAKKLLDIEGVHLKGEESMSFPVWETCDETRRKIRALLRSQDVSQAAFCRTITEQCLPKGRVLRPQQLTKFLSRKGTMAGNTSIAFYGAYIFFEKRRIKNGSPKSGFREEMEDLHPIGVTTTEVVEGRQYVCRADHSPVIDKYGSVSTIPSRGSK